MYLLKKILQCLLFLFSLLNRDKSYLMEVQPRPSDAFLQERQRSFARTTTVEESSGQQGRVLSLAWNCCGRRLASASADKTVAIFSFDRDRLKRDLALRGHTDTVEKVVWHPLNADLLASTSSDKTVKIWDSKSTS